MSDAPLEPKPELPSDETLCACLDVLGSYVGERGTMALHDPVYLAHREGSVVHLKDLVVALEKYPHHPASGRLQELLKDFIPPSLRSLGTILEDDAPVGDGVDLLDVLEQRLKTARRTRLILEERVEQLEYERRSGWRTANVLAAAGAMIAVIALIGWLLALGAISISWLENPSPDVEMIDGD